MSNKMDKVVNSIQTNMDQTMDTINDEVKGFLRRRKVSCITWLSFALLGVANIMSIVTFCAPGWAWTTEIAGIIQVAGEYYGLYGVWYICWMDLKLNQYIVCDSWAKINKINVPAWLTGFQAAAVLTLIFGFTAFAIQLASVCIPNLHGKKSLFFCFLVATFFSGFTACAQFITFSVGFLNDARSCCKPEMVREITHFELWYGFVVCCFSAGFYFATVVAGVCEFMVLRQNYKALKKQEDFDD